MIRRTYDAVMNADSNPLRSLPKMVRFQYMLILSYMWSVVFTLWVGSGLVFGFTVAGHTILLLGVFFTADMFRRARPGARRHSDVVRRPHDGTVLYDDVVGAPPAVPARTSQP